MLQWLRPRPKLPHPPEPRIRHTPEVTARMMAVAQDMDKHTLMHCIVVMVLDRDDITEADRVLLGMRIRATGVQREVVSNTTRPDR